MVAINRKRVHCVVVKVPVGPEPWMSRGALAHNLVPEADPYVAQLIQRLQDEVRAERRAQAESRRGGWHESSRCPAGRPGMLAPRHALDDPSAELEMPWFDMPAEEEPWIEEDSRLPDAGGDGNDDLSTGW